MENLLTCHVCLSWRTVIVVLHLLTSIVMTMASGIFQDQVPKWVTAENYYTKLRTFRGESLTAMSLSSDRRLLYLGAKNAFHIIDLSQPLDQTSAVTSKPWVSDRDHIEECKMKGKQGWQCQNFIQVVLKSTVTNRLLVCGTNAWNPMCRNFEPNSLSNYTSFRGVLRCPFSPAQKSTAIFAGGALYTATVTRFSASDSAIVRYLSNSRDIRSKEVDTKWLKIPEFIKSFDVGDWVMFFFREIAVEHVNSGEAIYSRVAKVCKSDMGGNWVLQDTWTTFQKARLNCSFPGAFPFYFNYLQDVHMLGEGDNITFYAVFTTGNHAIPGSAVCVFSLAKIKEIINEGQFKTQDQGTWYPVPSDRAVLQPPRPGDCSANSLQMPDNKLNFILEHPLMHQSVPNLGDDWPRFHVTRADYRIMQIAVHQQLAADGETYDVLFLGTNDGRVLKVVIVHENGQYRSNLLEEIFISPRDQPEGVVNIEVVRPRLDQPEVILVNTNSTVVELPLQRCANYTECACQQDPYCVFNNLSLMCIPFQSNTYDSHNVKKIQDCPKEVPVIPTSTPAECLCPTEQPFVTTDLPPPAVTSPATSRRFLPTTAPISTPIKGTPLQTTEERTQARLVETTIPSTESNEIVVKGKPATPRSKITSHPNVVDPFIGGSIGQPKSRTSPLFWSFFAVGWLFAVLMVIILLYIIAARKCKGNYQPTETEESVLGSSFKSSPHTNKRYRNENGKPPLMTSMQESPVKTLPVNGSVPQLRAQSLTPSMESGKRNSGGSYRPRGSYTYGVDPSCLTPPQRQPPTGGVPADSFFSSRLPSESESRPSASGASDSELNADDSDIWLKRQDGTTFGQEHEV